MTDDEDQYGYVPQAQSSTVTFVVIGVVFALIVGGIYASYRWERIVHAFAPDVVAYDQGRDDDALQLFMTDTFPKYIIAVSKRKTTLRKEAAAVMIESVATLPRIAWHAKDIDFALDDFDAMSESTAAYDRDMASDGLGAVNAAFFDLERTLRDMKAPYAVDAEIRARRSKKGTWRLRAIARTSEVWRQTTFRAGDDEVLVSRERRIDGLSLADLVHGKAKGGIALVLIENAVPQVANRYLPALVDGTLRDVFREPSTVLPSSFVREELVGLLPPDVQARAADIGTFAVERRELFEEIARLSSSKAPRWLRTSGFWLEDGLYQALKRRVLRAERPDLVARLAHYRSGTDFDPALVRAVQRANDALLDAFLVGVERHEAWHLLRPKPEMAPTGKVAPEDLAYIGALASAGDEYVITLDKTLEAGRRAKQRTSRDQTSVALIALRSMLVEPNQQPGIEEAPKSGRAISRSLLSALFDEKRRPRRTFVDSTMLDPFPESLTIRPEPPTHGATSR